MRARFGTASKNTKQVIESIGSENQHDPIKVADTVPEYLPNTAATRKNWAWYHDNITLMDKMAGDVLRQARRRRVGGQHFGGVLERSWHGDAAWQAMDL